MRSVKIIGHIDLDKLDNVKTNKGRWNEKEWTKKKEATSTCVMCGRTKYTSECSCEID